VKNDRQPRMDVVAKVRSEPTNIKSIEYLPSEYLPSEYLPSEYLPSEYVETPPINYDKVNQETKSGHEMIPFLEDAPCGVCNGVVERYPHPYSCRDTKCKSAFHYGCLNFYKLLPADEVWFCSVACVCYNDSYESIEYWIKAKAAATATLQPPMKGLFMKEDCISEHQSRFVHPDVFERRPHRHGRAYIDYSIYCGVRSHSSTEPCDKDLECGDHSYEQRNAVPRQVPLFVLLAKRHEEILYPELRQKWKRLTDIYSDIYNGPDRSQFIIASAPVVSSWTRGMTLDHLVKRLLSVSEYSEPMQRVYPLRHAMGRGESERRDESESLKEALSGLKFES
jgi:hypothetical protein